jgi:hypothetical protein
MLHQQGDLTLLQDKSEQSSIFLGSIRYRMIQPSVVTGAGNSKESTHHLYAELVPMRLYELIRTPSFAWELVRRHGAALQPQAQMLDLVQGRLVTPT